MPSVPAALVRLGPVVAFCLVDVVLFSHLLDPDSVPATGRAHPAVLLGYAAAGFAALWWRRAHPVPVFAAMWLHSVAGAMLALSGYQPTVGPLVALYSVAVHRGGAVAVWCLLATFVPATFAVTEAVRQAPTGQRTGVMMGNAVALAALSIAVWGIGTWVRSSRQKVGELERRRKAAAEEAVATERVRIARELHDIVAHAVTVIVIQAAGARRVVDGNPRRAGIALDTIVGLGQQATEELRRLLGLLRVAGEAESSWLRGLDDIEDVLDTVRQAEIDVSVETSGERRPLAPSTDLAAYRIVQEALTNVTKHAGPGTHATVRLTWSASSLRMDVIDDGGGSVRTAPLSTGHGLLGLAERVGVIGGEMAADHLPGGGFRLSCTLPVAS